MKENEKPENPFAFAYAYGTDVYERSQEGMTLRDYFANSAMSAVMSGDDYKAVKTHDDVAKWSYAIADAMLKERQYHEK